MKNNNKKKISHSIMALILFIVFVGVVAFSIKAEESSAIELSSNILAEDATVGSIVGSLSATDGATKFILDTNTGDEFDNHKFKIDGEKLKTNGLFDFETKSLLKIKVLEKEDHTKYTILNIHIKDVNKEPTNIRLSRNEIDMQADIDRLVGKLMLEDDGEEFEKFEIIEIKTEDLKNENNDNNTLMNAGSNFQSQLGVDDDITKDANNFLDNYGHSDYKPTTKTDDKWADGQKLLGCTTSDTDPQDAMNGGNSSGDSDIWGDGSDANNSSDGNTNSNNTSKKEDCSYDPNKVDPDDPSTWWDACDPNSTDSQNAENDEDNKSEEEIAKDEYSNRELNVFKIVGNNLKIKEDVVVYSTLKGKEKKRIADAYRVTIKGMDGKHEIIKTFKIEIFNAKKPPENDGGINWGNIFKKLAIGIATCYASGLAYSAPAQAADIASVPTNEIGNKTITGATAAKECGLDYAANALKQELILGMIRSITEWVKGGFEGVPAFLESPEEFLEDIVDKFVGNITNGSGGSGICEQFKTPMKFALNQSYYGGGSAVSDKSASSVPQCTLNSNLQGMNSFGNISNFKDADGSFNPKSLWDGMSEAAKPGNNAFGSFVHTKVNIDEKIKEENDKEMADVQRGNGFKSIKKCTTKHGTTYSSSGINNSCYAAYKECIGDARRSADESICKSRLNSCKSADEKINKKCKYVTPGSVVAEQVNGTVAMERENLLLADEFDELINALITTLMDKIFSDGLSNIDDEDLEPLGRDLRAEKIALLKMYRPAAYKLEVKIRKETKEFLTRYLDFLEELKAMWELRSGEELENDNKKWRLSENNPKYSVLVDNSSKTNIYMIEEEEKKAIKLLDRVNLSLGESEENLKNAEDARLKIAQAATPEDLDALFTGDTALKQSKIAEAFDIYRNYASKLDRNINGIVIEQDQDGSTIRGNGILFSKIYLNEFNKTRAEIVYINEENDVLSGVVPDDKIEDSLVWYDIKKLKYKTSEKVLIEDKTKTYEILDDIQYYNSQVDTYNKDIDQNESYILNRIPTDPKYLSIVGDASPTASSDKQIVDWKSFFKDAEKIILDLDNKKTGKAYLAQIASKEEQKAYAGGGDTYTWYSYQTYKIPVRHFTSYPEGLGDDEVNGLKGQGKYKTMLNNDGTQWDSYKIYIPPFAKKIALLLKSDDPNYKDYLYRMHVTYGENINHSTAKTLKYSDSADEDHNSLSDLFSSGKTSLINILEYNGDIGDELTPGINNMGIIFGEDEIKKYVSDKGGWLYIDLIKDNKVLKEVPSENTNLDILYYVDVDRSSIEYTNWEKKADLYLTEKNPAVQNITVKEH